MADGREFHAVGPAIDNVCSPNLVKGCGTEHERVSEYERSPRRRGDVAVVWTRSLT